MGNPEHYSILKKGVKEWNEWKRQNLPPIDFQRADLRIANLIERDLRGVDFSFADLESAVLDRANLEGASLYGAYLDGALLRGTNLRAATFGDTRIINTDLSKAKGLEDCKHVKSSYIDYHTLVWSGELPNKFLKGCGLPDWLIENTEANLHGAIRFYSCFISYSNKNQGFAERLHADLQDAGVRCWFAPEDMKIGDKIIYAVDSAIRLRDKLLVILSDESVHNSQWVEREVIAAFDEERERKEPVLFPIRIDDAILDTPAPWARMLRRERHIGDFTGWKHHDSYQKAFERLLRDLRA